MAFNITYTPVVEILRAEGVLDKYVCSFIQCISRPIFVKRKIIVDKFRDLAVRLNNVIALKTCPEC